MTRSSLFQYLMAFLPLVAVLSLMAAAPVAAQGYSGVVAEDGGVLPQNSSGIVDSRGNLVRDPGPGLYDPDYFARQAQQQRQMRDAVGTDLKKQQEEARRLRQEQARQQEKERQEKLDEKLSQPSPYLGRRQGLKGAGVATPPVAPASVETDTTAAEKEKPASKTRAPFAFGEGTFKNKNAAPSGDRPRSVIDSMMDALR